MEPTPPPPPLPPGHPLQPLVPFGGPFQPFVPFGQPFGGPFQPFVPFGRPFGGPFQPFVPFGRPFGYSLAQSSVPVGVGGPSSSMLLCLLHNLQKKPNQRERERGNQRQNLLHSLHKVIQMSMLLIQCPKRNTG